MTDLASLQTRSVTKILINLQILKKKQLLQLLCKLQIWTFKFTGIVYTKSTLEICATF